MGIYRAKTDSWYVERITILLAGLFVLGSVLLGLHMKKCEIFYFTGFVGFMLVFFSLTGLCPSSIIIHKLGVPSLLEKYCNRR